MNAPFYSQRTEVRVKLPTLHPDQVRALRRPGRFKAIRCGRRWGKTKLGITVGADRAVRRWPVGWFAPDYKRLVESYAELLETLDPVLARSSKQTGEIRTDTGGGIDFWTLDDETAGRGRKYKLVIIDEAAFTKDGVMMDIWNKSIRPTLLDYQGSAIALSNTNGVSQQNFLWQICNQPQHGFVEYHAPTMNNPLIPERNPGESGEAWSARRAEELAALARDNPPLVYQQEYLAEFVDWSGTAFFEKEKLLYGGAPMDLPVICDGVFAVIDSATKTGKDNDGTGVVYYARNARMADGTLIPLLVLDWDLTQIEGALLEQWLPGVFARLTALAETCRARRGSLGVWIEDKASGEILLQQARRRHMPVHAIDSKLTGLGKSERAISVSGYVYRGMVKLSREAYDRIASYKGTSMNHLLNQVLGFRVGSKDQVDDDLLDCFTYGAALALGNSGGF